MLIKSKIKKTALLPEGKYPGICSSVKGKPDDANPKKVQLGLKPSGHDQEVYKEVPASIELGSQLRKDIETLLGYALTNTEVENGFDPKLVIGKPCEMVIAHKGGAGGKPVPYVSVVLPAPATTPANKSVEIGEEPTPAPAQQTENKA